ncbi:nucleoside/nucleotide kinase family protein [Actibacterium pelagium]|uniref:Nucleoside triphosphate hydrolase n=1 Tax=Actibacterium pelagium TaxID=2029103 RepID=A0A917EM00_9RHOB|nr:nucleoside/nucleotide kinase family protein [Actibacterium pelagium]GGE54435.1 nucleoside triphosphate hydrolase [Actibacterium pelagium]
MSTPNEIAEALLEEILAAPRTGHRKVVAVAGPPASGKSTLSEVLAEQLTTKGCNATVVPMDGFHLDNRILQARGLLGRKGAPETFDIGGFLRLVTALPTSDTVYFPIFDRERDIAIAGAGLVSDDCDTVVVEGNYLLFDAPEWRDLRKYWNFAVQLDVPISVLRQRLIDRWLSYGLTLGQATARAETNDLRNVELVASQRLEADTTAST